VCDSPFFSIGISKENSSSFVLDRVQRVGLVDFLGEEVGLGKHDTGGGRIVGQICHTSKTLGFDDRAIVLEEALVVAQVVREYVEVVANERKSFWAWCFPHRTTVN